MSVTPKSLFLADCLAVFERMASDSVNLVYLDPPWYSNEGYEGGFWHEGENSQKKMSPEERKRKADERFQKYLNFLSKVLQQSYRVLNQTGSVYFHIDPHLSNYVRLLIDQAFDRTSFITEIIIPRPRLMVRTKPYPAHSTLLVYSKTSEFTYNPPKRKLTQKEIREKFAHQDDKGVYRLSNLTTSIVRPKLIYYWHGVLPPSGRSWRYSKERMEEMDAQGLIYSPPSGIPLLKTYLSEDFGIEVGNIWDDLSRHPQQNERTNFSAQQPLSLLKRVIEMGSLEGDVIMDPFCGSGTTIVAAEKLQRKWIACDILEDACSITTQRLREIGCEDFLFQSQTDLENENEITYSSYWYIDKSLVEKPDQKMQFIQDQVVSLEETRNIEFKEITSKNPVSTIKAIADQYAVAFLNSEGGSIFWGIRDNRIVSGVELKSEDRDEIRRVVGEKLTKIQPPLAPTAYRIEFHPIRNPQGSAIENLYVVELLVPNPETTDLFFTGSNEAWVRIDGGKKRLIGPEITQEILRRNGFS